MAGQPADPRRSQRGSHLAMALAGLTSRGRAFLAAGVTATAAGVVLDQRDLVRVGMLLLALPLAAAAFLTRARYRISAERRMDCRSGPVGSVIRVELTVHNLSRFPTPLLLGQDSLPPELGAAVGDGARFLLNRINGGGQSTVSYPIRPVRRGRYVVGPLSVRLTDPFGFCQILRTFSATDALSVLPEVVTLPPGQLSGQWSDGADGRARGIRAEGEQDATTRPYAAGDDRRRVHWRTTARTGELSVRREEQPWRNQATILIDTRSGAHSRGAPSASFEFAVSAAASIAGALLRAGYQLRLIDDVGRIIADSAITPGESGFGVMEALADLPLKAGASLLPVANRLSAALPHPGQRDEGGTVVAILGSLSAGDVDALARATQSGLRCLVLLIDADTWPPGRGSRVAAPPTANRDLLRLAGWSAVIAQPGTPMGALWRELNAADPTRLPQVGGLSTPTIERTAGRPAPAGRPPGGLPGAAGSRPAAGRRFPIPVLAGLTTLCTTLCLGNLFEGLAWWLAPSAGAILLAGVIGEAGRRIGTPWLVMPLLYLLAGWCYVIPVATHGPGVTPAITADISLAPTASTWRALHALADSGSRDIHSLAVPVPERAGFLFLTVAGVYLIAALVDGIACGLKRPAAAGLPLLALLAVPAAVIARGVGILAFLPAAASYLALLLVSGRRGITQWARLPAGGAPGIARTTGPLARRIGVVGLIAALAIPVFIPRYSAIARNHRGGGTGSATVIEPVVTLAQQLHSTATQPLLEVRTNTPEYLRLTALEHFDGQTFTLGSLSADSKAKVSRGLPAVAAGSTERVKATIQVLPVLHQRYLPVPYEPTAVDVAGDWRLASRNFTIFSAQTTTSGLKYTVTSQVATPTVAELRSASAGSVVPADVVPSTQLPANLPSDVSALSSQLTSGLRTEYDKAAAIQAYLRGPLFTYDLNGAPTGPNALSDFLFRDRRGYCEQFAGAMVVLARLAGIPARVAVGFTPGTEQANGSWLITNHDAHSWPELWFPQAGWVRFEPTPRDTSTDPPAYTIAPPVTPDSTPSASASAAPSSAAPSAVKAPAARRSEQPAPGTASTSGGSKGGGGATVGWTLGAVALAALLLSPALVRRRRRRVRLRSRLGPGPAHRAAGRHAPTPEDATQARWHEIVDTAADLGLSLPANLSPRRAVQHWARLLGTQPEPEAHPMPAWVEAVLLEAAQAQEVARYASPLTLPGPGPAVSSGSRLQSALKDWERSSGWQARLRAAAAPRSLLGSPDAWTTSPGGLPSPM